MFKTKLGIVGTLPRYLNLFPSFHIRVKSFIPPKNCQTCRGTRVFVSASISPNSCQLPWRQLQNNPLPSPFYALGSGHLHFTALSAFPSQLAALASHSIPVSLSCPPSNCCFAWPALQCYFLTGNLFSFVCNIVLFMLHKIASLLSSA